MAGFTIGSLAKQAQIGVETVRFYERQGLLEPPQRKESGYRQYDEQTVHLLQFIRRAKQLGFTLKEIKSLLALQSDVTTPRSEIRRQTQQKIAEIDAKIEDLQRIRRDLKSLTDKCHGDGSIEGCPILGALHGTETSSKTG